MAPSYLKSPWKVEQLQQGGLRATHPQRAQRRGQDTAEEAGDVGFPRGVKQLALHRPHPVQEPSAQGHGGTGHPHTSCAVSCRFCEDRLQQEGGGTGTWGCSLRIRRGAPSVQSLVLVFAARRTNQTAAPAGRERGHGGARHTLAREQTRGREVSRIYDCDP